MIRLEKRVKNVYGFTVNKYNMGAPKIQKKMIYEEIVFFAIASKSEKEQ